MSGVAKMFSFLLGQAVISPSSLTHSSPLSQKKKKKKSTFPTITHSQSADTCDYEMELTRVEDENWTKFKDLLTQREALLAGLLTEERSCLNTIKAVCNCVCVCVFFCGSLFIYFCIILILIIFIIMKNVFMFDKAAHDS